MRPGTIVMTAADGRPDPRARWATFDCYGTLVDWNAGIGDELERLFGAEARDELLARYHEIEPTVERQSPDAPYREVMADDPRARRRIGQGSSCRTPKATRSAARCRAGRSSRRCPPR